jgi:hypothetical protein
VSPLRSTRVASQKPWASAWGVCYMCFFALGVGAMTFGFWPRGFPPNVFADQASQARADLAAIAEELAVYASMHEG